MNQFKIITLVLAFVFIVAFIVAFPEIGACYYGGTGMFGSYSPPYTIRPPYTISQYGYSPTMTLYSYNPLVSSYASSLTGTAGPSLYTYASSATLSSNLETNLQDSNYVTVSRSPDGGYSMRKVQSTQGLTFLGTYNCADLIGQINSYIDSDITVVVRKRTEGKEAYYDIYGYPVYTSPQAYDPSSPGIISPYPPLISSTLPIDQIHAAGSISPYGLQYQPQYSYYNPGTYYMGALPNTIADIFTLGGGYGYPNGYMPSFPTNLNGYYDGGFLGGYGGGVGLSRSTDGLFTHSINNVPFFGGNINSPISSSNIPYAVLPNAIPTEPDIQLRYSSARQRLPFKYPN